MGRRSLIDKEKLVTYDKKTDLSKCLICRKNLRGNLVGNIKRHYVKLHDYTFQNFADLIQEPKVEINSGQAQESEDDVSINTAIDEAINQSIEQTLILRPREPTALSSLKPLNSHERESSTINMLYETMEPKSNQRDDCNIYGEHIACKLRYYSQHTKNIVQHHINTILFEADMGNYDVRTALQRLEQN